MGTPEAGADQIIDLWQDGTVDGHTLQPPGASDDIAIFVDQVSPILQARGVFRQAYAKETVRQRYEELPHPRQALAKASATRGAVFFQAATGTG